MTAEEKKILATEKESAEELTDQELDTAAGGAVVWGAIHKFVTATGTCDKWAGNSTERICAWCIHCNSTAAKPYCKL